MKQDDCRAETKSAGGLTFNVGAWGAPRLASKAVPTPLKSIPDKADSPPAPVKVKKGHTRKARQKR
ncbi:MAG: hypothetical protein PXX77_00345 [Gallionella sp.]|nr:hypothetical protein [Gallionella sp.]